MIKTAPEKELRGDSEEVLIFISAKIPQGLTKK
jgi:hypothetical protein